MIHDTFNDFQTPQTRPTKEENILDILIQTGLKAKDLVERLTSIEVVDELLTRIRQQEAAIQEQSQNAMFQEDELRRLNEDLNKSEDYYENKCTEVRHCEGELAKHLEKIKKLEKKLKGKKGEPNGRKKK